MSDSTTQRAVAGAPAIILDGNDVYEAAPLGTQLRYFDGTPQPPARFNRKLRDWQHRNNTGRLVEKCAPSTSGAAYLASFVLDEGSYGSNTAVILTVRRHYLVTTPLHFEIVELPRSGMVRVLHRWNERDELKFLAPDMAAAEIWMQRNRYSNMVTEVVGEESLPDKLTRAA